MTRRSASPRRCCSPVSPGSIRSGLASSTSALRARCWPAPSPAPRRQRFPVLPGSDCSSPSWPPSASRWSMVSPRSPIAATRSCRAWRSISSSPARQSSSARRGSGKADAHLHLAATPASQEITLPGADAVRDVPILGPIYSELLSGHSILVYIAFLMVPLTWWVLFRTRFGLRLRAVGENPAAVDTAGISVDLAALSRRHHHRYPDRHGRRLSVGRPERRLREGHDRRQGLHRSRCADLRQVETRAGDVCLPAVRFPRRCIDPYPGQPGRHRHLATASRHSGLRGWCCSATSS